MKSPAIENGRIFTIIFLANSALASSVSRETFAGRVWHMIPEIEHVFKKYEAFVEQLDGVFESVQQQYSDCVKCKLECSDCCHMALLAFPRKNPN